MSAETVCSLSVDHAIKIAKIIATAPEARLPMISQVFQQASINLEGLEEFIAASSLGKDGTLIDTKAFLEELTAGRKLSEQGYLFTTEEFNQFCFAKNLSPRLTRRHLYAGGYLEASKDSTGKIAYSINLFIDGRTQRRIAIKDFRKKENA